LVHVNIAAARVNIHSLELAGCNGRLRNLSFRHSRNTDIRCIAIRMLASSCGALVTASDQRVLLFL